jgi:putative ABC transport system permease protein
VSTELRERPVHAGPRNGGVPAMRVVIRWAWRLLRREWRQQLLILALIIVAVSATFIGATVATDSASPATAAFGTAQDMITLQAPDPHLAAQIALLEHSFGPVDVIENQSASVPGSVQTFDLRAQDSRGPFGQPLLALLRGRYPDGADQVAVTGSVATDFRLTVGSSWRVGGVVRRVVGIVENPQNLLDEFALVIPGQVTAPTEVTVLFDGRAAGRAVGPALRSLSRDVTTPQSVAAANPINPATISLAAATLGMMLIALVGIGGFTVLAQRRLRAIGMLGAQGATSRHIGLVVRANGVATGVVGALAGFALGFGCWLVYRPSVESSSHHAIGAFQIPWLVVGVAMALAVAAAYVAGARPARAIARVPVVTALSGRPPAPRPVRRAAGPAGLIFLVAAFLLLGAAGSDFGTPGSGGSKKDMLPVVLGILALTIAVVLLSPAFLGLLAGATRRAPVAVRLAVRDLARYRARSGSALAAISVSVLIAMIVIVVSAARFGNVLDWAGPNLASNQLIVYAPMSPSAEAALGPGPHSGPRGHGHKHHLAPPNAAGTVTGQALAVAASSAHQIAATLGAAHFIALEEVNAGLQHATAGRQWDGQIYVGTPQLLAAFGIRPSQVSPDADVLSMRPGLASLAGMQLTYGNYTGGAPSFPCPRGTCRANPDIEEVSALPSGTSAPNTVFTEQAVRELGLSSGLGTNGWLIETPGPLTPSQISSATRIAAAAGMTVETRNSIPSLSQIIDLATIFAIVLAFGIVAMSVGLIRSETASDLRTLAATGASSSARRMLTGVTAGVLALAGAVIGTAGGYLAAIGYFRTNQLDRLSALSSVPTANLLLILVGMPVAATAVGWLLAGREPGLISRKPLE